MTRAVAMIAGASRGLGSALCALLSARDHRVVALGRDAAVREVASDVEGTAPFACDLTAAADVDRAFMEVESRWGPPSVVIYNAHTIALSPSMETSLASFEDAWRVNCLGAFTVARRALPAMLERRAGTLVFTGATASRRGGARTAAFASSKFALRGLSQALAREHAAAGIHVAHVLLDGLIWSERTRARFAPDREKCMPPERVAEAYLGLIEQDRSAWTHELCLRPWTEKF
jgi:NAD(P)-dependent dehydrogenase (short-subunit alcohol dehydrogenase family)